MKKITEDQYTQENLITISIAGFSKKPITIKEAKSYDLNIADDDKKQSFFSAISGNINDFNGDILLDGFSVKNNLFTRKYLKQNCLCLTKDMFLDEKLTLKQNLKIVSLLYSNFDLSNAAISSFLIKDIADTKIEQLTERQKSIAVLSYTVCCPAIIWVIDEELLQNITNEQKEVFNNALKIRTKHGGIAIIVS